MKSFDELLLSEILSNIGNHYNDNYDFYRFGSRPESQKSWKSKLKDYLKKRLRFNEVHLNIEEYQRSLRHLSPYFYGIRNFFEILADENSRLLLISLITFQILGEKKYKLPLSTSDYWKGIKEIDNIKNLNDFIRAPFVDDGEIDLYKFDLKFLNIPIKLYNNASGLNNLLHVKQYEYISDNIKIKPEPGDIVLDCGACWGDNALFFSNQVKNEGHIYSFEFLPGNIEVFNLNVSCNPQLNERITLIAKPLGEISDQELFYIDNGPGSRVTKEVMTNSSKVTTITIDDFFVKFKLNKVDFIKMDIEGAELSALKGGLETINKFRPKLAISIYHSLDDFVNIPQYLHSLNLGYKFYLNHGTIHQEESVLLAFVNKN